MPITVLPKGNREAAITAIHKHEKAEESWRNSPERESAMKEYPGEYVAVRDSKVIEHFKEMEDLFRALRERRSKGENLLEILTDRMVPKANSKKELREHFDIIHKMYELDPTRPELVELRRRANSITPEELNRPFTI